MEEHELGCGFVAVALRTWDRYGRIAPEERAAPAVEDEVDLVGDLFVKVHIAMPGHGLSLHFDEEHTQEAIDYCPARLGEG